MLSTGGAGVLVGSVSLETAGAFVNSGEVFLGTDSLYIDNKVKYL